MNDVNEAEAKLTQLNIAIGEAEKRHNEEDVAFLKRVLSDDLRFRRAKGPIVTKREYLWDLIQPENTFEELVSDDVRVTLYEDTAVVSLLVSARFKRPDAEGNLKEKQGVFRNTRIFLRQEIEEGQDREEWQCAFWFNSEIKPESR